MELKPYRVEVGERFGTLTVLRKASRSNKRGGQFRVACDCSYAFLAKGSKLKRGLVKCNRCSPGR